MEKSFNVNSNGFCISCKLYANDKAEIKRVVLFGHGFAGHKDNKAAERLAKHLLSKNRDAALMVFNWPCHGDDVRKTLRLEDCGSYLHELINYIRETYPDSELYGNATSFGAYLFLKYVSDHGDPFKKLALRCPAVNMYDVVTKAVMTDDDLAKLEKGKPVLVGFDRKIKLDKSFTDSLIEADISVRDFTDRCDDILIMHGTKDEIVPIESAMAFADDNLIEFVPIEGADHRFKDPACMDKAIKLTAAFFGMN